MNERAEGEQYQEEISMQYYGSPSRSAVRRREYSPTQQSAHAATTRLPPDDFRPPAQPPGCKPALKPLNIPNRLQGQYSPPHANTPHMMDFAKFLARRELVTTGLTKFDDTPENFRAWQSSFLNATQGLGITYSEELDLLVKWLGKE